MLKIKIFMMKNLRLKINNKNEDKAGELIERDKYIEEKLSKLNSIFAHVAVGDFSKKVEIPDEDGPFSELYFGIDMLLGTVRGYISELKKLNDEKSESLLKSQSLNRDLEKIQEQQSFSQD